MSRLVSRISNRPSSPAAGGLAALDHHAAAVARMWTSSPSQRPVLLQLRVTSPSPTRLPCAASRGCAGQSTRRPPAVERSAPRFQDADDAAHLAHDQRLVGVVHQLGLVAQLGLGFPPHGVGAVERPRGPPDKSPRSDYHGRSQTGPCRSLVQTARLSSLPRAASRRLPAEGW